PGHGRPRASPCASGRYAPEARAADKERQEPPRRLPLDGRPASESIFRLGAVTPVGSDLHFTFCQYRNRQGLMYFKDLTPRLPWLLLAAAVACSRPRRARAMLSKRRRSRPPSPTRAARSSSI